MVKKASFFERLKSRLRTSDVRVASSRGDRADGSGIEPFVSRAKVSSRKLPAKEEAILAVNEGFKDLADLLRSVQSRVDEQGRKVGAAADSITRLPEISQSQLELMREIAQRLEKQNEVSALLVKSFGDLPQVMPGVREALVRVAAVDERATSTLDEFRKNMDHIHNSMDKMVAATTQVATGHKRQVDTLAKTLTDEQARHAKTVEGAFGRLEETQKKTVQSLRQAQVEQSTKIGNMVEDHTRVSRWVAILLGISMAALIVIAFVLIVK